MLRCRDGSGCDDVIAAVFVAAVVAVAVWMAGSGSSARRVRASLIVNQDRNPRGGQRSGAAGSPGPRSTLDFVRAFPGVGSLVALALRRRRLTQDRLASTELITDLATELRTGAPPGTALERASRAGARDVCPHAMAAARFGGDVAAALNRDAAERGLPALRALAALWRVSHNSGAGMAQAAHRLAKAEASNEAARRELATQLAGPKASARVLAGLPAFGLLLGSGLGASPVSWLVGSPLGLLVLVAGIGLEVAGLLWVHRLVRSVECLL